MNHGKALGGNVQFKSSLWEYAVKAYSAPEIEKTCLDLQEEFTANVNIILWCSWLEAEKISISSGLLEDVLRTIDTVSLQTVAKLREVRRALSESGNFTKVQAISVKKHILNAELMVEKILLHRLQDLTCRFLESSEYVEKRTGQRNLDLLFYLDYIGVSDSLNISRELLAACSRPPAEVSLLAEPI